jgi:hypothetical protein
MLQGLLTTQVTCAQATKDSSVKFMQQLSYPQVATQIHPQTVGDKVVFDSPERINQPDEIDLQIAEEMLAIRQHVSIGNSATGEWDWINRNKRSSFLRAVAEGDRNSLALLMCNLFRGDASFGIVTGSFDGLRIREKRLELENNVLLDLDTWSELTDQSDVSQLHLKPEWGNPFGAVIDGGLIAPDTPRHDYFAVRTLHLAQSEGTPCPAILEIGGGYGGMALQIVRRSGAVAYIDCDLPETLLVAYYFLRKSCGKAVRWAFDGVQQKDLMPGAIILVPAEVVGRVACDVRVVFNSNSLSEMAKTTVEGYFDFVNRLGPKHIYHQNSNFLLFPKSVRHIEVLARDFPIDRSIYSEIYRSIAPWQTAGGRYREFLFTRRP